MATEILMESEEAEAAPLVSEMSAGEVLNLAEKQTAKAQLLTEQMENQQYLTLSGLIEKTAALVDRLTAAADSLEIKLEVMEQNAEQIKADAQEIKDVITPEPENKPEIAEAKAEAGILGHRAKIGGFLI